MEIKAWPPSFHRRLFVFALVAAFAAPGLAEVPIPCEEPEQESCEEPDGGEPNGGGSPPPPPSGEPAPVLVGDTSCVWGSYDCNRCVNDVVGAFNSLRDHGDVMGFWMNGFYDDLCYFPNCDHWEGIQRLPAGGGRYLAVSRKGPKMFNVVEMGSRNTAGVRFRSNRLHPDYHYQWTPPPAADLIVYEQNEDPGFKHAGGMQALGHVLAVPLEDSPAKIVFFDMTNPAAPVRLYDVSDLESSEAGTVSLAALGDGRFLLVVGRKDAEKLDFYVSSGTNLSATSFVHFDTWDDSALGFTNGGDPNFSNYQILNFVTDCDGSLYLIGTHENMIGQDWADLFQVLNGNGNEVLLIKVAKKHLYCSYPSPGALASQDNHCNLDAGGGAYVDPNGMLILYGTEHADNGPFSTVRFMEFRARFPNASCNTDINQATVELYDDFDWSDRGLMIDYPDRNLEDYSNYDRTEGFEDKASSVFYCIPPGWRYRLYKDKYYGGSYYDLIGVGVKNLEIYGFGDKTSSSRWLHY
jgi:hypothetical protein